MEYLREQIKVVIEARGKSQQALEARNTAHFEWENQNKALLDEVAITIQQTGEAESKLRDLTLQAYAETGNKAPMLGLGIREVTKLEYDTKTAFDWAVEHKMAIKLDTSAFEKIAKLSPPEFVTVFQEPQATIATQLKLE